MGIKHTALTWTTWKPGSFCGSNAAGDTVIGALRCTSLFVCFGFSGCINGLRGLCRLRRFSSLRELRGLCGADRRLLGGLSVQAQAFQRKIQVLFDLGLVALLVVQRTAGQACLAAVSQAIRTSNAQPTCDRAPPPSFLEGGCLRGSLSFSKISTMQAHAGMDTSAPSDTKLSRLSPRDPTPPEGLRTLDRSETWRSKGLASLHL